MAKTESRVQFQRDFEGISLEILGDSRPFSKFGRSICYLVRLQGCSFLVDCGAPIFEYLPREEIEELDGLFATHSHEDHRRWFTDLALFLHYLSEGEKRLNLITTDQIQEEFMKNSRGALERTLSQNSREVIEVPYDTYVNRVNFGPDPNYKIHLENPSPGSYQWQVVDAEGNPVPPNRAKVVISDSELANRPRLLFRDPETGDWVEPEQYYPLSSDLFYENEMNPHLVNSPEGDTVAKFSPVKAPVWHGPPTIGIDLQTENERLVFSSDTVYDPKLWKSLTNNRKDLDLDDMSASEFDESRIIYGNINNYIQRSWSEERLERALGYYEDSVVVHDCGPQGNPVHTEYEKIRDIDCEELILTHSPDRFVSEFPIAVTGKKFRIIGNDLLEETEKNLYPLQADVYFRDFDQAYVGFENEDGDFKVVEKNNVLDILQVSQPSGGDEVMRVDLYRDVNGHYLPYLQENNARYRHRPDRKIEKVLHEEDGSTAEVVRSIRTEDGGVQR